MKRDTFGEATDFAPPVRHLHPLIEVLRKRRYDLNISQEALANRMGFSRKTLQHWETGVMEPTMRSLLDWAQALGMTVEVRDV